MGHGIASLKVPQGCRKGAAAKVLCGTWLGTPKGALKPRGAARPSYTGAECRRSGG
jgi:hypothetical protein